ncbi:MAG TPA: PilZ domain-containing protein, partial [Myxococcales bacterium]|nr:PilZ domain-containing protein [Myxococcales bacterium]
MSSKAMQAASQMVTRERRFPLHVPVLVRPRLPACWSVNLSRSGIGLVANASSGATVPAEGDEIAVEFPLPDAEPVSARGTVCWRADSRSDGHTIVSLGVRFVEYAEDGQLRLTRYLHQHRQRAIVAFCPAGERHLVRQALEPELELDFCESSAEVVQKLDRGDVAALAICGHDAERASALAEQVAERAASGESGEPGQQRDLAARV